MIVSSLNVVGARAMAVKTKMGFSIENRMAEREHV